MTEATDPARPKLRKDIQGLRALAVVLVVAYHVGVPHDSGGFVGVDAFFVISGYLITGQLARELSDGGRISMRRFYARRARRILPVATLVTIVTMCVSAFLLSPIAARSVDGDGLAASLFVINYRLASAGSNYLNASLPPSPLQHYWSLSVEEQFYVVWPALLLVASLGWIGRRRPSLRSTFVVLSVLAGASFASSVFLTSASPEWAYYALWSRGWELAAGGLLQLGMPRIVRLAEGAWAGSPVMRLGLPAAAFAGLGLIVSSAALYSGSTPFPGIAALLPVSGALIVIAAGTPGLLGAGSAGASELLSPRPVQAVGRWSYSWYLWHFPALVLVPYAIGRPLPLVGGLAVAAATLALAAFTFRFVEQPIRRSPVLVSRPAFAFVLGGTLIVSTVTAGLSAAAALPSLVGPGRPATLMSSSGLTASGLRADLRRAVGTKLVPSNLRPSLANAATDLPLVYDDGCHLGYPQTANPPCVFGDTHSKMTVVLFGDSHAAQWFPALDEISTRQHWRLVSWTKSGCPPVDVTVTRGPSKLAYPQCSTWRLGTERRIAALHPQLVITSWDRSLERDSAQAKGAPTKYKSAWSNGVAQLMSVLSATKAKVVVIGNTPVFDESVPECLSEHLTDVAACVEKASSVIPLPRLAKAELRIEHSAHAVSIDPMSWVCTPTTCPVIVGDLLLYRDNDHLLPGWTRFVAPLLSHRLERVVR